MTIHENLDQLQQAVLTREYYQAELLFRDIALLMNSEALLTFVLDDFYASIPMFVEYHGEIEWLRENILAWKEFKEPQLHSHIFPLDLPYIEPGEGAPYLYALCHIEWAMSAYFKGDASGANSYAASSFLYLMAALRDDRWEMQQPELVARSKERRKRFEGRLSNIMPEEWKEIEQDTHIWKNDVKRQRYQQALWQNMIDRLRRVVADQTLY